MPRIVIFDELATPQRALGMTRASEPGDPYIGRTDVVIDPDLSLLATLDANLDIDTYLVPFKYWKHDTGNIVEFSQAEKDALAAAEAAQAAADAAQAILDDKQAGKDVRRGRSGQSVHDRANSFVIREELNRVMRGLRQLVGEIEGSTGGTDNLRAAVAAWSAGYDLTNVTKLEWNTQFDAYVDGLNLDDPDSDA